MARQPSVGDQERARPMATVDEMHVNGTVDRAPNSTPVSEKQ